MENKCFHGNINISNTQIYDFAFLLAKSEIVNTIQLLVFPYKSMPRNFLKPINPKQHNPVARRKKVTHHFEVKDFYYWEAKRNGFRARSAFKLLEIQEKFTLIKPNMNVLDI
jgi:hypothetical protein